MGRTGWRIACVAGPLAAVLIAGGCAGGEGAFTYGDGEAGVVRAWRGPVEMPEPLKREHEMLHAQLEQAVEAGGRTGEAAEQVREALSAHFEEENRIAMPPLGLLRPLSRGEATEEMRPAIEMARETEEKLDEFLEEHRQIHAAIDELERVAEEEGKTAQAEFARKLRLHARTEEEVLYPATILVGRVLERELGN